MVKASKTNIKIISPFFLLLAIILVGVIYNFNRDSFQDIRGRAEEGPGFCQDKCIGQDRCGKGPEGDTAYNDPCCDELAKTGDPFACGYPQRLYCLPDQCAGIPEDVPRQRCGGSRQNWCNLCKDNNCPGYGGAPVVPTSPPVTPSQPSQPTSVPVPTSMPILPTEVISTSPPPPTQVLEEPIKPRPQITYIPIIVPPYTPPTLTPTPTPFKFNLPNILPPKEKVQSFFEGIRLNLLDFFSKILP